MNKHFRVSGSTFSKLEELGVRASAVLERAGLPQGFVDQPRVLLSTKDLFALWRAVGEVSTNPAIGLLLGTENRTERFHPVSLAALSTENFGSAIDQIARYKQLTSQEEIVADALHISSRTLQRRLQEEGSSFQRVLDEARHRLARHYLHNSVLELNEAAYLLGCEDGNSFLRAFRTGEGIPPARYREMQRTQAAS